MYAMIWHGLATHLQNIRPIMHRAPTDAEPTPVKVASTLSVRTPCSVRNWIVVARYYLSYVYCTLFIEQLSEQPLNHFSQHRYITSPHQQRQSSAVSLFYTSSSFIKPTSKLVVLYLLLLPIIIINWGDAGWQQNMHARQIHISRIIAVLAVSFIISSFRSMSMSYSLTDTQSLVSHIISPNMENDVERVIVQEEAVNDDRFLFDRFFNSPRDKGRRGSWQGTWLGMGWEC